MARVRLNKQGEIVLTLSRFEARMTGDALDEAIHRHHLTKHGMSWAVMRAIDRGIKRATQTVEQEKPQDTDLLQWGAGRAGKRCPVCGWSGTNDLELGSHALTHAVPIGDGGHAIVFGESVTPHDGGA